LKAALEGEKAKLCNTEVNMDVYLKVVGKEI